MSSIALARQRLAEAPWQLWTSQLVAILRYELRRCLWMRRSIWLYLIALAPAGIIALHVIFNQGASLSDDTQVFAGIFQFYYLRLGIFFACMGLFTWLFRGEIVEKSLHYYFLAPVRRELLVIGKFVAGLAASSVIFALSVWLCFVMTYSHFGAAGRAFVFDGPGLRHLLAYMGVTVLACLGYGSLFLALSLVFKNPILPGITVLGWETIHAVLPSLLQKFSVMFYLKQLCPVTIPPQGLLALFSVVGEPVSAWIAVPGLMMLSAGILVFACFRIRRTEISYLAD
jgi:ABC-type transport system involved in multi-copper enzyme maturation permease subunit